MTWYRVDDTLAFHPKVLQAGNAAMGLWVRAGAWCSQQLTDGHVPAQVAATLGRPAEARALVSAGLWEEVDGGYAFHDWADRQPSREQVEAERLAAKERQRRAREAASSLSRRDRRRDSERTPPDVQPLSRRDFDPPDPSHPDVPTEHQRGRDKRGTRIPDDFAVTDELRAWASEAGYDHLDLAAVTERFFDYWRALPGQRGVKLDWPATWRNWVRREADNLKATTPATPRTAESILWDKARRNR